MQYVSSAKQSATTRPRIRGGRIIPQLAGRVEQRFNPSIGNPETTWDRGIARLELTLVARLNMYAAFRLTYMRYFALYAAFNVTTHTPTHLYSIDVTLQERRPVRCRNLPTCLLAQRCS
jgi:hypothetical protein